MLGNINLQQQVVTAFAEGTGPVQAVCNSLVPYYREQQSMRPWYSWPSLKLPAIRPFQQVALRVVRMSIGLGSLNGSYHTKQPLNWESSPPNGSDHIK